MLTGFERSPASGKNKYGGCKPVMQRALKLKSQHFSNPMWQKVTHAISTCRVQHPGNAIECRSCL